MSNTAQKLAEFESPCTKVCVIHPAARMRTGCLRSIRKIKNWLQFKPPKHRAVMENPPSGKARIAQRQASRYRQQLCIN